MTWTIWSKKLVKTQFSCFLMFKAKPPVVSHKHSTVAQQSPMTNGWLGVSGLSAPTTATNKKDSDPKSRTSPASSYTGGQRSGHSIYINDWMNNAVTKK